MKKNIILMLLLSFLTACGAGGNNADANANSSSGSSNDGGVVPSPTVYSIDHSDLLLGASNEDDCSSSSYDLFALSSTAKPVQITCRVGAQFSISYKDIKFTPSGYIVIPVIPYNSTVTASGNCLTNSVKSETCNIDISITSSVATSTPIEFKVNGPLGSQTLFTVNFK